MSREETLQARLVTRDAQLDVCRARLREVTARLEQAEKVVETVAKYRGWALPKEVNDALHDYEEEGKNQT